MFTPSVTGGISLNNVDVHETQLNALAVEFSAMDASVNSSKLTRLYNSSMSVYESILSDLIALQNSMAAPVIELDMKSYTVFCRWVNLAASVGRLRSLLRSDSTVLRVVLDNIGQLAVNYGGTKRINIIRDFIHSGGDDGGGGLDGNLDGNDGGDAAALLQYSYKASVSFDDIVGMADLKRTITARLRRTQILGSTDQGGSYNALLLYGPPGTGKTLFAEAIALELGYLFVKLANRDLVQKYVGEGERVLTEVLRAASMDKIHKGVFILFDEIDSVTGRGADSTSVQRSMTAVLLQELGRNLSSHVFLCATTNFPQQLDAALLRRFLPSVLVDLPDEVTVKLLLKRSVYYEYLMAARPHIAKDAVEKKYSQSNVASLVRLFEDELISWASDFEAKYISASGYSLQDLLRGIKKPAAILTRSSRGGGGDLELTLSTIGTAGLPPPAEMTTEALAAVSNAIVLASNQIATTNPVDLEAARNINVVG